MSIEFLADPRIYVVFVLGSLITFLILTLSGFLFGMKFHDSYAEGARLTGFGMIAVILSAVTGICFGLGQQFFTTGTLF